MITGGAIPRKAIYRILDANLNRAREGLRVSEEIFRFVQNDPGLTRKFKGLRHGITAAVSGSKLDNGLLEQSRDSAQDPGRVIHTEGEFRRGSVGDILGANLHRVGEALRVLEEFSKILDSKASMAFKALRFRFYDVEKAARRKI